MTTLPQDYRKYTIPTDVHGKVFPTNLCGKSFPTGGRGNVISHRWLWEHWNFIGFLTCFFVLRTSNFSSLWVPSLLFDCLKTCQVFPYGHWMYSKHSYHKHALLFQEVNLTLFRVYTVLLVAAVKAQCVSLIDRLEWLVLGAITPAGRRNRNFSGLERGGRTPCLLNTVTALWGEFMPGMRE